MIRLSMNETTTYGWSFDEDVVNYKRAGYTGIGVCEDKLRMFGEEFGVRLLLDSGLKASSLSACGGFTGDPRKTRQRCIEDAERTIQLACCMDVGCVILRTGGRSGHIVSHARRLIREAIVELVDMAESFQVDLAIEPMHANCSQDEDVLNTLTATIDLVEQIGSERLKIAFDTYHLGFGDVDLLQIERIARRVAIVQLGDGFHSPAGSQNRCSIGNGIVPNAEIVMALAAGGYEGFYEIELRGSDVEYKLYDDILAESLIASLDLAEL